MESPEKTQRTHGMLERVRERKERHRARSRPYRVAFGTAGALFILGGLLLSLPFVPGPGLLLVAIGLGMLALEFDRAERLLERILGRVESVTDRAARTGRRERYLAAAVALVAVAALAVAVAIWDLPVVPG